MIRYVLFVAPLYIILFSCIFCLSIKVDRKNGIKRIILFGSQVQLELRP